MCAPSGRFFSVSACLSLFLLLSRPRLKAGALVPSVLHRRLCYLLVEAVKCSPSVSDDQSMTRVANLMLQICWELELPVLCSHQCFSLADIEAWVF